MQQNELQHSAQQLSCGGFEVCCDIKKKKRKELTARVSSASAMKKEEKEEKTGVDLVQLLSIWLAID